MTNSFRVIAAIFCFVALLGCDSGPAMHTVYGEVKFEGQPVPKGMISFVPEDPAQRTAAEKIENGRYTLRMTAGKRRVEIMATRDNGPVNPVMGQAPQEQYIPEKYNVSSELKAEITPDGKNEYNFDLQP
jgi:hypothetical protein